MSSQRHGIPSSEAEVTNISSHGLWLLYDDREFFLSYDDFPWFRDAKVREIQDVQQPSPGHFRWPALDVDLSVDIIQHPHKYPNRAK